MGGVPPLGYRAQDRKLIIVVSADVRFAQVERTYSERGARRPGSGGAHGRLPPNMASVITDCCFNIASMCRSARSPAGKSLCRKGGAAGISDLPFRKPSDAETAAALGLKTEGEKSGSQWTLSWREMDSTIRFPVAEIVIGGQ